MPVIPVRAFGIAVAAASFAVALPARAEDVNDRCVAASNAEVALRQQGKLIDARKLLFACAAPSCDAPIQQSCAERLRRLNDAIPTVVLAAKDGAGAAVGDARVSMDGQPLAETLDGRSIPIDPGSHTFVFEAKDGTKQTMTALVLEGAHDQTVSVTIGAPLTATPERETTSGAPRAPSPWKTIGWIAGGAGVVGLAVGTVFGIEAIGKTGDAHCNSASPKVCGDGNALSSAKSTGNLSTVFFVAGGVLAAAGITMWLVAPSASHVQAGVTAANGGAGAVLRATWQ
jgi:hypothetical protein